MGLYYFYTRTRVATPGVDAGLLQWRTSTDGFDWPDGNDQVQHRAAPVQHSTTREPRMSFTPASKAPGVYVFELPDGSMPIQGVGTALA